MGHMLHARARTTPEVRREIQNSPESVITLAGRYGVNPKTTQKWRTRDFVHDAPMGPKIIRSKSLSQAEEAVVVAFRIFTQLPLDDCLYSLQGFDTASDPLFSASLLAATWSVEVAPEKQRRKKSSSNRIL